MIKLKRMGRRRNIDPKGLVGNRWERLFSSHNVMRIGGEGTQRVKGRQKEMERKEEKEHTEGDKGMKEGLMEK